MTFRQVEELSRSLSFLSVNKVVIIFHQLNKGNNLKLTEVRRRDEVKHTNEPNYCLFNMTVHHPASKCFVLKDKIQALVDANVLAS